MPVLPTFPYDHLHVSECVCVCARVPTCVHCQGLAILPAVLPGLAYANPGVGQQHLCPWLPGGSLG